MSTFSPIAQTSFANSTAYDAHRPTYPAESVQHLLEQCRVAGKRGARIIDLAAGTGKFTEALAAREEGFEILAVEPHADMRRVLSERGLKGVRVVDGTAEDVPVENGWADAVFVAQVGHQLISFLFALFSPIELVECVKSNTSPHTDLCVRSLHAMNTASSQLCTAGAFTTPHHTGGVTERTNPTFYQQPLHHNLRYQLTHHSPNRLSTGSPPPKPCTPSTPPSNPTAPSA
jgi:hypothetical protein